MRDTSSSGISHGAPALNRRELLKVGATIGAGLVLGATFRCSNAQHVSAADGEPSVTAWVRIAPDGAVTLIASQSEMGQGTTTTLAAALAHELYVSLDHVGIEFAPFAAAYRDPVYNWMFTGNSQSISSFYDVMRTMGAAAREMLIAAAAAHLNVAAGALVCGGGIIRNPSDARTVTFGEVAAAAAKLDVPKTPQPRSDSTLDGTAMPRWDIPGKVDGSAVFGIDVKVPGMLVAALKCAPRFGSVPKTFDAALIKASPGVVDVVEIPGGIAVVAKTYWQARTALSSANIVWRDQGSSFSSGATLASEYTQRLETGPFFKHKSEGDATRALAGASNSLEAVYQLPFQPHATMEPMNCTAHVSEQRCEVWVPTQGVEMAQNVAQHVTGLPSDRVVIHRTMIGGGFGRRLLADFLKQTLILAQALKQPVKVIWSREEDMTHDFYRPAMLHRVRGAVDADGKLVALAHRVVSPSHMLYIFPRGMFPQVTDWTQPVAPPEAMDTMAVEGLLDQPYAVANQLVEQHRLEVDVPVSVWRTTGHGPNNFVLESFVDELAAAAKIEPLAFRRSLLADDRRALKVLDVLAEKSGWNKPSEKGVARGVAFAAAFGGLIGSVVELRVRAQRIQLHRVVTVVDCGRTLDPGIAESNILGGIVWGISGMRTAVTFAQGAVQQTNFDSVDPAHLWETPPCEVHFVESGAKLGGTGELGPVPIHAAIGNAVFAATGKRIRSLPIADSGFSFA